MTNSKGNCADVHQNSSTVSSKMLELNNNNDRPRKSDFSQEYHEIELSTLTKTPKIEIVWRSTIILLVIHLFALKGAYLVLTGQLYLSTFIIGYIHGQVSALGTTAGAHRLWAHKSYKAKLPLQILLCYMQTVACQNSIHEWVRDHRTHHKFTETDADPHNAKRGFFFAHVGWLMCRKHEDVKVKGKTVSMDDLEDNPVVMFQKKHYIKLIGIFCFLLPTLIPWYFCGETLSDSWSLCLLRYALSLNFTWLVNSAAHIWGSKPYDRHINPTEHLGVSLLTGGEGWHNYHHVFPWDYKASEFGLNKFNPTTVFINFFAWIGWAYDLQTVPQSMIVSRMRRTGDGSGDLHHYH